MHTADDVAPSFADAPPFRYRSAHDNGRVRPGDDADAPSSTSPVGDAARRGAQAALVMVAVVAVVLAFRARSPIAPGTSEAGGNEPEAAIGGEVASDAVEFGDNGADDPTGDDEASQPASALVVAGPETDRAQGTVDASNPSESANTNPGDASTMSQTDDPNGSDPEPGSGSRSGDATAGGSDSNGTAGSPGGPETSQPATNPTTTTTQPTTQTTPTDDVVVTLATVGEGTTTTTQRNRSTVALVGPTAVDDQVSAEDGPVVVDVLANDTGGSSSLVPSSLRIVTGPGPGRSAAVTSDFTIRYTHSDWEGTDRIVYEVCDRNGLCDRALLTVEVDD